ncbi:MAG TPA: transposase family protein [archaeon]|nr:transposase family protein [archaeon]
MLTYKKLLKKPKQFKTFTGLSVEEFDKLHNIIESQYPEYEHKRLSRKDRLNAIGQGRDFKLPLKERLIMQLMYYRLYTSYTLLEYIFNLDQSNVYRDIRHLEKLVEQCMPLPEKIHKRIKRISTIKELLELFPEAKCLFDATEQEIPRPKNKKKRRTHYSGKKKKHTVKTQLMTNKKGLIIHKTKHVAGRVHDYELWKRTHPSIPPDIEALVDSGYQGIQTDFPDLKTRIPIKKPRGKQLTKQQKRYNKKLSKERVLVEHAISKVKKFGIIGQEFRNRLNSYDTKMSVVTGIVNFRTMLKEGMDVLSFVG